MVLPAWLTFEAIKDIQLNYLNFKPQFSTIAVSGGLNEASCNGLQIVETTVPGITFTVEEDRAKVGQNVIFHNVGVNDFDIITGVGNITVTAGTAVLGIKVSDAPEWVHYELPSATYLT